MAGEGRVDVGAEPSSALRALAVSLAELHREAGAPSTRVLARRTPVSHDTIHRVLRCEALPRWRTLQAVVHGLNGDVAAFRQLWSACVDASPADETPKTRQSPDEGGPGRPWKKPAHEEGHDALDGPVRELDHWAHDANRRVVTWHMGSFARGSFAASLNEATLLALIRQGRTRRYPAKYPLYREGDSSTHVMLIFSGVAEARKTSGTGFEVILGLYSPGAIVGDVALFDGRPQPATITTLTSANVLIVRGPVMRTLAQDLPELGAALLADAGRRLRASHQQRLDEASMSVTQRLARLLYELGMTYGRPSGGGLLIDLPLSQNLLAGAVGTSRRSIERVIQAFRSDNLVATGYSRIMILDLDGLSAASSGLSAHENAHNF